MDYDNVLPSPDPLKHVTALVKKSAFVNYDNSREAKAIADALKEEQYFVYSMRRLDPQALDHLVPDPLSVDQFISSVPDSVLST
jgi:hypothetical protein